MIQKDKALLERWRKQRDGEAFRTLVSRYSGMVYAACKRIVGNAADAEDVAQETFEALAAAGTKPGNYVGAWLHRVATYHAISHVRREVRRNNREQQAPLPQDSTQVQWKDIYDYVDEAVNDLPDKLRLPLIAHFLEGRSKSTVGDTLGLSRQVVSYRIDRGLERVRAALQRKGIYFGVALLASLLESNAVQAAPATLIAQLGKIALVGPGATAPVAASTAVKATFCAITGGSALKTLGAITAVVLVLLLGVLFAWKQINQPYPTQDITEQSTFTEEERTIIKAKHASQTTPESEGEAVEENTTQTAAKAQVLEPGTVISGIVLDENYQPVPGATVRLDNRQSTDAHEKRKQMGYYGWGAMAEIDLRQTTNAQGEFFFERVVLPLSGDSRYLLTAASDQGHAMKPLRGIMEARNRYHQLVLEAGNLLKGQLVDEENKGVPDVSVHVSPFLMRGETTGFTLWSDENGFFSSRPVAWGMYELLIVPLGYVKPPRPWIPADGQTHIIQLERGGPTGSVSGRAILAEDGSPLANVGVKSGLIHAATDQNGFFELRGLLYGIHFLTLTHQENHPYILEKPVGVEVMNARGVSDVELEAVQGITVQGAVLSKEDNNPVPNAILYFNCEEKLIRIAATCDEQGRYIAEGLCVGDYKVMVAMSPQGDREDKDFSISSWKNMEGVDFLLDCSGAIQGTVENAAGNPVAGASVALISAEDGFSRPWVVVTDGAGVFTFPSNKHLQAFYLQAYGDGAMSQRSGRLRPGQGHLLRLEEAGRIEGTVVDTEGYAVSEAIVIAIPKSDTLMTAMSLDGSHSSVYRGPDGIKALATATGAFQMEPVLPGELTFEVYLASSQPDYPIATTKATVQAGQTLNAQLVVDLSGLAEIQGTVTIDGQPVMNTIVEVYTVDRGYWMRAIEATTNTDGWYSLRNVRSGEVRVTAYDGGGGQKSETKTVHIEEDELQTIDFNFERHEGAVEGYVVINGEPATRSALSAYATNTGSQQNSGGVMTDGRGYYRIDGLAPGTYTIRLDNLLARFGGERIAMESEIEVTGSETAQCDFSQENGSLRGVVLGLKEGERATVALFYEPIDPRSLLSMAPEILDELIIARTEAAQDGRFEWTDTPAGTYFIGAVALPTGGEDSETVIEDSILQGRYATQAVEIIPGETTEVQLALP
jgi:RNA polymerase sigma factor (sigma-70 family)